MGDYTNCLMRGYGVVPSAPMNVRILNIDVTFAIVHWDTPKILGDTVNHYDVYYRQIDDIYYIARNVSYIFLQILTLRRNHKNSKRLFFFLYYFRFNHRMYSKICTLTQHTKFTSKQSTFMVQENPRRESCSEL